MTQSGHAVAETRKQEQRIQGKTIDLIYWTLGGIIFVGSLIGWTLGGQGVPGIGGFEVVVANFVMTIAALVVGMAGFGLAQVANGLMPFFMSAAVVSIMFTPLAFVASSRTFLSVRQHFKWRNTLWPVLGLLPALPVGAAFFASMNNAQLRIAIAVTLLISVVIIGVVRQMDVVQSWVENSGFSPGWKTGLFAGICAGLLGGAVAIPGPPMILYGSLMMAASIWAPGEAKAVFTSYFPVLMVYRLINLAIAGKLTVGLMLFSGLALPGLLIGTWLGIRAYNRIPQKTFGWIVLALLTVNAVMLLLSSM